MNLADEEIPAYDSLSREEAQVPRLVQHSYTLRTLGLSFSSHAKTPESSPIFYTGSSVRGTVTLRTKKKESPKSISVTIGGRLDRTGQFVTDVADDPMRYKIFWSQTQTVFPRGVESSANHQTQTLPPGQHDFPFSFSIPRSFVPLSSKTLNSKGSSTEYDLPPTFHSDLPYALDYSITAFVKRGFLKPNDQLEVKFRHVLVTKPERSVSPLMQAAFRDYLPLPTPDQHPEGYSVNTLVINGRLLNNEEVRIASELYLIIPTQYPTGSPINFFLKFSSIETELSDSQTQALDILSSPRSCTVSLRRSILMLGQFEDTIHETIANATIWKRRGHDDPPVDARVRLLQGEIELRPDVQPDFAFTMIQQSYFIVLDIKATGFHVTSTLPNSPDPGLLAVPIQLANTSRSGDPRSRSYAPAPNYSGAADIPPNEEPSPVLRTGLLRTGRYIL